MRPRKRPTRQRSIRALLAAIFVVPLASLLALWGFAASVTLSAALQAHRFSTADRLYGGAAQTLDTQLSQERLQVFIWLSSAGRSPDTQMMAQFRATNTAASAFKLTIGMSTGLMDSSSRHAYAAFVAALDGLPTLRARVTSGQVSALGAFEAYNAIVDAELAMFGKFVVVSNTPLYVQAAATVQAGTALEMADREVTLISGALLAGGQMSEPERLLFAQEAASRRVLLADALTQLSPGQRALYVRADHSSAYRSFAAIEDAMSRSVAATGPIPVNPLTFGAATGQLLRDYEAATVQNRLALSRLAAQESDHVLLELALAGGLGLLAIVVSILLMIGFGRRIGRDLTGLRGAALELAHERLPSVVERLSLGNDVDVATDAAPLQPRRIREVTEVSEAFSAVQGTAIEAAAGQARLRRGISQVFLSLAWRSQSLLHRQLGLLDVMERKTTDPDALNELFQLDHLTTRMRRHAEGLVILAGSAPGRGWRNPVPIVDVLRGAIAEIEDYARVSVIAESQDAVTGPAVADVIHLLAELIENATEYSPHGTEVSVRAGRVARGLAVEIEDRGVGITQDELAVINERLSNPPALDLAQTDQLGLFVVSLLAAKHGIKVTLRGSPFGGTTAIVLLPHAITVGGGIPEPTVAQLESTEDSVFVPAGLRRRAGLAARVGLASRASPGERGSRARDAEGARVSAGDSGSAAAAQVSPPTPRTPSDPPPPSASPGATAPWVPSAPPPPAGGPADAPGPLPRRVRQASLAERLRYGPAAPTASVPGQSLPVAQVRAADLGTADGRAADLGTGAGRVADLGTADGRVADLGTGAGRVADLGSADGRVADLGTAAGRRGADLPATDRGPQQPGADEPDPVASRALGDSLHFGWQLARSTETEMDDFGTSDENRADTVSADETTGTGQPTSPGQ